MIPFVRILGYGNTAPKPKEFPKAIQNILSVTMYLDTTTSKLYALGTNASGQLGTGDRNDTTGGTFMEVLSGVESYYLGNSGTVCIMLNGTIMFSGSSNYYSNPNGNLYAWTDITASFTAIGLVASDIKDAVLSTGMFFLLNDGSYACVGSVTYSQWGIGSPVVVRNLTRYTSSFGAIDEVCGTYESTIIRIGGKVYRSGYSVSSTGTTVQNPQWTAIPGLDNVVTMGTVYQAEYYFLSSGAIYTCGFNQLSSLKLSQTTSGYYANPVQSLSTFNPLTELRCISSVASSGTQSPIMYNDGKYYICGQNSNGKLGVGLTNNPVSPLHEMDMSNLDAAVKYVASDSVNRTWVMDTNKKLYACGTVNITGFGSYNKPTIVTNMPWY
jgi:hypothetical protein